MIILSATNKELSKNSKFSYLTTNYSSGITAIVVKNSDIVDSALQASDGIYALLGEFGSQQSEIVLINTVTTATHTLNLGSATIYAHPQDTKVTIIRYNQVKFYQTAAATFDSNENPLNGNVAVDIQAYRTNTIFQDTTNTTGYGFFCFYNETTAKITTNSNAIPYTGFSAGSVKEIFDSFFSMLNNKEGKLIDSSDAFFWLNEGYNRAQNELNLVNQSYKVESEWTVTTESGIQEYNLPTDFSNLISVTNVDGDPIDFINLTGVPKNDDDSTYNSTSVKYSIRGTKILFSPGPTSVDTYYVYYQKKTTKLSSYYENIELPDNNFYPLVDFMMYRAATKLNRPNPQTYLQAFLEGVNAMKLSAHKQDNALDSWNISDESNV